MNLLAVLVAAVVGFVAGFIWYGPLFGKKWREVVGYTDAEMQEAKKKGMGGTMFLGFVSVLVMAWVLATVLSWLGIGDVMSGLEVVFLLWVGFIATVVFMAKLWGKNKSTTLFWIDSLHYLVVLGLMSIVLTLWQ